MPWRLPVCWYFTLPVAVILKRFLAPDLVFSLGIWLSLSARSGQARRPKYAPWGTLGPRSGCSGLSFNRCHGSPYWPGSECAALWQRRPQHATACRRRLIRYQITARHPRSASGAFEVLGKRSAALARRQHHDHLPAFKPWFRFDLGERAGVHLHALEQFVAELLVRHLATAEAKGDFHLVALFEEPLHGAHLHIVIVVVDHRPELDLLNLDDFLFFAGFRRLLLRLKFVFAVIQDLADGRRRVGGDF